MKFLKNLLIIFTVIILGGLIFSWINGSSDSDKDNNIFDNIIDKLPWGDDTDTEDNVISYTQGFTSDFSGVTLYPLTDKDGNYLGQHRFLVNGEENASRVLGDDAVAQFDTNNGMINYYCAEEGTADMSHYPKIKIKPINGKNGYVFLNDFDVLTVDFDIAYDINTEGLSARYFKTFLSVWDFEDNQSAMRDVSMYHSITSTGPGHYTLVLHGTTDVTTMEVQIYKDGEYVSTVTDFINDTASDTLVVSCLNIDLPFSEGDMVSVDNVEFRIFDIGYDGPITDLIANPEAGLKSCKDAVLYEG